VYLVVERRREMAALSVAHPFYELHKNEYADQKRKMKVASLLTGVLFSAAAIAQVAPGGPPPAAPVSYASSSELSQLLSQLQQTSQSIQTDLSALRIEKWKTDANTRRGTAADVTSIQRNLKEALPEITGRLRNSPESLPTTFELYRNLDALYDVFSSVVESAGAFGSRDEYQALQNDLSSMEQSRHSFADRMSKLATATEGEVANLRLQLQKAQAVQETAPPKKVVVDDTEEPKKPVAKKKPATKKPKPATPAQTTPTDGTQQQTPAQNPPQNPPSNP
jgi:hypothetical protein